VTKEERLDESVFRKLRDFIYERTGIYISDSKKYLLENRLQRRIHEKGFKGYEDYFYFLRYNADGDEIKSLFDAVTTNETYFFREPQHFDILFDHIFPELSSNGRYRFRVWSAGCSTGEEPYTISMLFRERYKVGGVTMEIIGTDLSETVLEAAKRGVYSSYSVRNVPESFMKKYFRQSGHSFILDDSIKRSVRFQRVNLVDEFAMKRFRNYDVIFCRNVLIYFDDKAKKKVVSHLFDALKPGGYLFIGASESLHNITRAFKPLVINRTVVYKRG